MFVEFGSQLGKLGYELETVNRPASLDENVKIKASYTNNIERVTRIYMN